MFRARRKLGGLGLASGDVQPTEGQLKLLLQIGFKAKGRRSCHLCWCWLLVVLERDVLLACLCNAGLSLLHVHLCWLPCRKACTGT